MWTKLLLLTSGISFGLLSSAGVFTVLISVGLIPRFAEKTHTANHILLYEEMSFLGTVAGALFSLFPTLMKPFPGGRLFLIPYGLFSGIFVGCLALAIAEMLNAIPIFARRIHFRRGMRAAIVAAALGKLFGSLVYFYLHMGTLTT